MPLNLEHLRRPIVDEEVQWRVSQVLRPRSDAVARVQLLAYIDARAAMERLDAAATPVGWRDSYEKGPAGGVLCTLELWDDERGWVAKRDVGVPSQTEGEKGAISDSFKRACVKWGVGRNLYELGQTWVDVWPSAPSDAAACLVVYCSGKFKNSNERFKGYAVAPSIRQLQGHTHKPDHAPSGHVPPPEMDAAPSSPPRNSASSSGPFSNSSGGSGAGTGWEEALRREWIEESGTPPCPIVPEHGPLAVNTQARGLKSPHFVCQNGCKREGTDYDRGFWRPKPFALKAAKATIGEFADARGMAFGDVAELCASIFGVPATARAWTSEHCSKVIDGLKADLDGSAKISAADPGSPPHEPQQPQLDHQDDIPF